MAKKNTVQADAPLPARARDPHRVREARRYENPIPSREFILEVLTESGVPLTFDSVAEILDLTGAETLEALRRRLLAMERDGQLIVNRRGHYCLVNRRDLIAGRVIGHPDGFGFLKPDEGGEDLYLSAREMRGLFHDDRAVVRVVGQDRRGRREGALVEVLERNTKTLVGRLQVEAGVGFLEPGNRRLIHDIVIPQEGFGPSQAGQIVLVEIVEQPTRKSQPIGRVLQVLGEHLAPGMETDIAIHTHNLPVAWPEAVLTEVAGLEEILPDTARQNRADLRKTPLVTIDGTDARDFDDAVYCEPRPKGGYRLLVCIADVSAYVRPGSALDEEARNRGNSVYFPNRVIPMLPEVLSNGLCSLNPGVDRLCMACEMSVGPDGAITRSRFFPAVMRSAARLTYDQVAAMLLDGDSTLCSQHATILPHLRHLFDLYQVLARARKARGTLDFDTTESRFEFDDQNQVIAIRPLVRHDAHRLIEECMLAANVATARLLTRKRLAILYRVHNGPTLEKLTDLKAFLGQMGLKLPGDEKPEPADYAQLMASIRGRPDEHLIQTVLLRSLSQAVYSSSNNGHFGLAYPAYTHFTSPIRRYPDLLIHRAIRYAIEGGPPEEFEHSKTTLQPLGEHCSATERRADEATRDVAATLKCQYMQHKIGESFDGIISGVHAFGLFVELQGLFVDGLIHITALENDYYHFDPVGHRLTGERTGQVFRLGDPLRVKLAGVNVDERKIDFIPGSSSSDASPRPRKADLANDRPRAKKRRSKAR
ncbi:RNase R [Gammaproteobacteria bacterium]